MANTWLYRLFALLPVGSVGEDLNTDRYQLANTSIYMWLLLFNMCVLYHVYFKLYQMGVYRTVDDINEM